jgi:hypothetical protein
MPNHITNIVSIAGKQNLKELLAEFLDTEDGDKIDFNKVIPMPDAVGFRGENLPYNPHPDEPMAKAYERNLKLYGFKNWYDWSIANWGTKWDCYEFEWLTERKCTFLTAWSPPDPILRKLAGKAGRKVRNRWMDEGDGKWHTDIYEPWMADGRVDGRWAWPEKTHSLLVKLETSK